MQSHMTSGCGRLCKLNRRVIGEWREMGLMVTMTKKK